MKITLITILILLISFVVNKLWEMRKGRCKDCKMYLSKSSLIAIRTNNQTKAQVKICEYCMTEDFLKRLSEKIDKGMNKREED